MKKLTKITALALALALLLGMTAFAAATEVIKTVDFTGYSDLSALTELSFTDASAATQTTITKDGTFTFGTGSFAYDKVYYQSATSNPNWQYLTITPINGVNTIANIKAMWQNSSQNPNQVGFTLPEAWEYNEDYALVAEMSMIADARAKGSTNYHYQTLNWPGYSALLTEEDAEGTETNAIRLLAGWGFNDTEHAMLVAHQTTGSNSQTFAAVAPRSVLTKQTTVIRPFVSEEETSLDLISGFDKMPTYNVYHQAVAASVTKVHGFFNNFVSSELWGYTGYRLYKVSLNPADFTITSAKNVADVDVTDAIKVTFSQPITTNISGGVGSASDANLVTLENALTITPEGGEALVYGEDYTISIAEKASGTGIYDEMTITPVNPWVYGKNYTIALPTGLKNIARVEYADATAEDEATVDTIAFSVVAAPTFNMTLTAYKGLTATGTALEALEDGTTYFAVSASYTSGKVVSNGTIRFEILDGDGNVVKYVTNKKDLTSTATFGVAAKVEAGYTARVSIDGGVLGTATID